MSFQEMHEQYTEFMANFNSNPIKMFDEFNRLKEIESHFIDVSRILDNLEAEYPEFVGPAREKFLVEG